VFFREKVGICQNIPLWAFVDFDVDVASSICGNDLPKLTNSTSIAISQTVGATLAQSPATTATPSR
jgi:hypothetical protein